MRRVGALIARRGACAEGGSPHRGARGGGLGTAGSVIAWEGDADGPPSRLALARPTRGTHRPRLGTASRATQDTVAVLVEGYEATSRQETMLFNLLSGFVGAFALMRLSTAGIRGGWWPAGNVRLGGRHIHHFVPGILIAFASGDSGTGDRPAPALEQSSRCRSAPASG